MRGERDGLGGDKNVIIFFRMRVFCDNIEMDIFSVHEQKYIQCVRE